ncbi:MAG: outer membrane lipoprotein carrier protein LolA [Vicinamibacterales bacterium]
MLWLAMACRIFGSLLVVLLAAGPAAAQPSATDLAASLQRKYATIRDFSADFVHTYTGGVLKKRLTEKGRVYVKKPGRMRWEYTSPERKLFVSDGTKVYSYIPADKQVIVGTVPEDTATTPALFLAGKGDLTRDFIPSIVEPAAGTAPGTLALKLVPKAPQPDYDWLVLLIEPGSLSLRGLLTADSQGGTSTITFSGLKENVGLADKEFEFRMPRGVDIITDSGGR